MKKIDSTKEKSCSNFFEHQNNHIRINDDFCSLATKIPDIVVKDSNSTVIEDSSAQENESSLEKNGPPSELDSHQKHYN
jgi:hypothetical protein